jgi:hypothetical protein
VRHHHGSSLLCTGGAESECSFCGSTNAGPEAYDGDILEWITDETSSQKRKTMRHRSNSSGGGGGQLSAAGSQQRKANAAAIGSSSLLSGLNLADPFAPGSSLFNSTSTPASFSSSFSSSQLLFSSKTNPLYHTARDLKQHELTLERSVRLCDTRGYCDTLCVCADLLDDGATFATLLDHISQGGFLQTPCYAIYDAKSKVWLWDVPAWFRNRNLFSLGAFLANKLEMVLWMRYWEATGADPRKVTQASTHTPTHTHIYTYKGPFCCVKICLFLRLGNAHSIAQ